MKACNQCGKCCIKYGKGALSATQSEIDLWELFNPEIYEYVKNNDIWYEPSTGIKLEHCPFLVKEPAHDISINKTTSTKYSCAIYEDRPEDCRHYPSLVSEMIRDECEMIEVIDLNNHDRAQKNLDYLMRESRPSKS